MQNIKDGQEKKLGIWVVNFYSWLPTAFLPPVGVFHLLGKIPGLMNRNAKERILTIVKGQPFP